MKQKTIRAVLALIMIAFAMTTLQAQSYAKRWAAVEKAQAAGLPQTAIDLVEQIYQKAKNEKNIGQMLKAFDTRSASRQTIDPDSFYVDLRALEQWAETTTDPADRAVLDMLVALTYADYASQNRYMLNRRNDLIDNSIDDPREWGRSMFVDKVLTRVTGALSQTDLLAGTSTKRYMPFVTQQTGSRYVNHSLTHLLTGYGVSALTSVQNLTANSDSIVRHTIEGIYAGQQKYFANPLNPDAMVLVGLDEANWLKDIYLIDEDTYIARLDSLIQRYGDRPVSVEVYLQKAALLNSNSGAVAALDLCRQAIARHPRYERINAVRELAERILAPVLTVSTPQIAYPNEPIQFRLIHANLDAFTMNLKKDDTLLTTQHFVLNRPESLISVDTICTITAPDTGAYLIEVNADDKRAKPDIQHLAVSRFRILSRGLPNDQVEVIVLDAHTGQPVEGAEVDFYTNDKGDAVLDKTITTNADGRAETAWKRGNTQITARKGNDIYHPKQSLWISRYSFSAEVLKSKWINLLTDRTIYRPGQTVFVKGIAYNLESDTANVIAGQHFTLELIDANGRTVGKQTLTSNAFGSFNAEFVIPQGSLNGSWTVRADQTIQTHIRVEEYKRPTFAIELEQPEGTYRPGDTLTLNGRAETFSGVPLADAQVEYVVNRNIFRWWGGRYSGSETIATGTVQSNADGTFNIPVELTSDSHNAGTGYEYYVYTVTTSVTIDAGETQTAVATIMAGNRSMMLGMEGEGKIRKDGDISITFSARNLNDMPVATKGQYALLPIDPDNPDRKDVKPVITGSFTANTPTALPEWAALPSGEYTLKLTAPDDQGREVTFETGVVLFSASDQRPPVRNGIWLYEIQPEFDELQPAEFLFGTSDEQAYVMMDVFAGNRRVESRTILMDNAMQHFVYPYKAEYGDGLTIMFFYVKAGSTYTRTVSLKKRLPNRQLKMAWSVFRDRLVPGQQEQWKLTVANPDGTPADAEVLATMYDASLDKIWPNNQDLSVRFNRRLPSVYLTSHAGSIVYGTIYFNMPTFTYPGFLFDAFNNRPRQLSMGTGMGIDIADMKMVTLRSTAKYALGESNVMAQEAIVETRAQSSLVVTDASEPAPALRTNFNETAFFYPHLRTNAKGETVIDFTLPESLTRWNVNAYAHTRAMFTGRLTGEVVAAKDFMLTPNLPRFVRIGDRTAVSATVANLTNSPVSGKVTFTLFDPFTERVIATQTQNFDAEMGRTTAVTFFFEADDTHRFLGCRLQATAGTFSDGEQHLLPVLSNKERVTETLPLPIDGKQKREFDLQPLFNSNSATATNRRMTIEMTGNPAWYAVQALPSINTIPLWENAINWATSAYANTLAAKIVAGQPRMKAVVDAWHLQPGGSEAFLSNLEKNQDLKNILLNESPWLLEATTEREQRQRIATLFDLNRTNNINAVALQKLQDMQLHSGAWPWWKGMSASRHITGYVVQLFARLAMLTGEQPNKETASMIQSAFNYLHSEALEEYKTIRAAEEKGQKPGALSGNALQYLYLVAIAGEKVPAGNQTAYAYFLKNMREAAPTMPIVSKAQAAIVLSKAGSNTEAKALIRSLIEYLTTSDVDRGAFFAFNESPGSWNSLRIPAHVAVMEAIDLVGGNDDVLNAMKRWLLGQKQTQQWNSPVDTADAVYALLQRGTNPMDSQGDVRIRVAGRTIETLNPKSTFIPGLSYVREVIEDKKTLSDLSTLTVEKRDEGQAWGAVFAQYDEMIDNLPSVGAGLSVTKNLFIEHRQGDRVEWFPISADHPLTVGSRVMSRLTIRVDRAMDFVQLRDSRAACLEPLSNLSGYHYGGGTGYYVAIKDASTNYFFDSLVRGVYVLEHTYVVSRPGQYQSGGASLQSAYAPEFAAFAPSVLLKIE